MPRPWTSADMLVDYCRRMALAGLPLPSLEDMGAALGFSDRNHSSYALAAARKRGLVRVEYGAGGQGISAIVAADGSWRATRGLAPLPQRRCLRCRRPFTPEHRHNFLCGCPEGIGAVA